MRADVRVCGVLSIIAVVGGAIMIPLTAQSLDTLLNNAAPAPEQQVMGEEMLAEELPVSEDVQPSSPLSVSGQPAVVQESPAAVSEQPIATESTTAVVEPSTVESPLAEEIAVQEAVPLAEEQATAETPPAAVEVPAVPPAVVTPVPQPKTVAPDSRPKAPAQRHKGHFLLGDEQIAGEILSSKEDKRLLIDGDIIYARLKQGEQAEVGQVVWIYHVGPSIYDTTLKNVSVNQATLIGKLRVLEVKGGVLSGQIVRAYSPVLVGDVLVK